MSKIYGFICKSNQVILFLILIFAGVFIVKDFLSDALFGGTSASGVKVMTKEDSHIDVPLEIEYRTVFYKRVDDVLVFQVFSSVVNPILEEVPLVMAKASRITAYKQLEDPVNMLFASPGQDSKKLFEHDVFIKYSLFKESGVGIELTLNKNVYLVVSKDTNKDGYLDGNDSSDFYLSDADGNNLKLIMSDVEFMTLYDNNRILFEKADSNPEIYYVFNVETEEIIPLDTKIR